MLADTQDKRYFERMASSLGDKTQILSLVEGNKVLDVGAGGGELAEVIRLTGREVWALDGSHAATQRMSKNFPELNLLTCLAHEVGYLAPETKFSTIVCSSIFHEVYSYGTPETGPYSVDALSLTLKALHDSLDTDGVLVIRDGIMPTAWNEEVLIRFKSEEGLRFWEDYHRHAPFASWAGDGQRCINLHTHGARADYTMSGNLESAMEFLYTYTWGWQSSQREMKELYGVFTEEEYINFIEAHGFKVESSSQYLQPGYHEHLSEKVDLLTLDGTPHAYPASNFVLKARKV